MQQLAHGATAATASAFPPARVEPLTVVERATLASMDMFEILEYLRKYANPLLKHDAKSRAWQAAMLVEAVRRWAAWAGIRPEPGGAL